jgi:hypothetical protein
MHRRTLAGSPVGSITEPQEILDFCAENGVAPDVELILVQGLKGLQRGEEWRCLIDMISVKPFPPGCGWSYQPETFTRAVETGRSSVRMQHAPHRGVILQNKTVGAYRHVPLETNSRSFYFSLSAPSFADRSYRYSRATRYPEPFEGRRFQENGRDRRWGGGDWLRSYRSRPYIL